MYLTKVHRSPAAATPSAHSCIPTTSPIVQFKTSSSTPSSPTPCTHSQAQNGRGARASSRVRANAHRFKTSAKAGPSPFPQPNFPYIYSQASARRTSTRARALVSKPSTSQRACISGRLSRRRLPQPPPPLLQRLTLKLSRSSRRWACLLTRLVCCTSRSSKFFVVGW